MSIYKRRKGTGSVCCVNGVWHCYGPESRASGKRVKPYLAGGFESRFVAERWLNSWVDAQRNRSVAA